MAWGSEGGPKRPRARAAGLGVGELSPGPHNAITDVAGVRVGHATLVAGAAPSARTGGRSGPGSR